MIERRVVDQPTFDAIECNRCGVCCEGFPLDADSDEHGFWNYHGPLGWLELYAYYARDGGEVDHFAPMDPMLFFGQLIPSLGGDGVYRYKCGYFERDGDGLGVCTAYNGRPAMCSEFPYGRPMPAFVECAWNVELIDFEVVQGVL